MTSCTPSDGPPDLLFLLSWASHALQTEHAAGLAELGISPRAHYVLAQAHTGELTQREIGERCGVDKTTMVVTLDQLERAGLAERRPVPTDRRARLVAVTPAGEQVLRQAQQVVRAHPGRPAGNPARAGSGGVPAGSPGPGERTTGHHLPVRAR